MDIQYTTKEEVLHKASEILEKSISEFIPDEDIEEISTHLSSYGSRRKGYLGDLVEKYLFGQEPNSFSEADLMPIGAELKTTPVKKAKAGYRSKERLVFSMIDYKKIIDEKWDSCSFLSKNKLLMLMFYLYEQGVSILDYKFKFVHLLDLLADIPAQDIQQIRKDWEYIVAKIRKGEAHLLSEGDTYYLGACTKAKNSRVLRDQSLSAIQAKPRAFSLKQTYLNFIIRNYVIRQVDTESVSIYQGEASDRTIEEIVNDKFRPYIGMTGGEIAEMLNLHFNTPKNFKRLLANNILTGGGGNKIEELEKANITLKAITLEHTGKLKESISFPAFDYKDLITQTWYDEKTEMMSDFYAQLETQRFLFVIFHKIRGSKEIVLRNVKFWNFPMKDIGEAEKVFDKTVNCIKSGKYEDLPKISDSAVAHVRPHGADGDDKIETPQGTFETKKSFWLNAKYIEKALKD